MVIKIYVLLWVVGLVAAGVCYLTGNMTPLMQIVFGFLTFSMLYLGIISVIPGTVFHAPEKH
jgi:hypothetical protein